MKKALVLALALVMVLSMAACSKQPSIVGDWVYEMNLADTLKWAAAGDNEETLDTLAELGLDDTFLSTLTVKMDMSFTEDNRFTFRADEQSLNDATEKLLDKMVEAFPDMIEKQTGMSFEDFKATLEAQGSSWDDMLEELRTNADDALKDSLQNSSFSGVYKLDGSKLFVAESGEADNEDDYLSVELTESTLKILGGSGDIDQSLANLLPLVFTKK